MKKIHALQNSGNRSSRRRGLIFIPLGLVALLAILPKAQALSPAPDGGYPGQNTAEGQSALLHLPAALTTRPLVGPHWVSTSPATTTRASAQRRSLTTLQRPETTTPPMVLRRSLATPQAPKTWPTEHSRSLATPPDSTTRPMVSRRSRTTPPAGKTRPMELLRVVAETPLLQLIEDAKPCQESGEPACLIETTCAGNCP